MDEDRKAAIAKTQPLMKFVRTTKMAERWAMVPTSTRGKKERCKASVVNC